MAAAPRPVYLLQSALLNAAGDSAEALHGPAPAAQALEFAPERLGFPLAAPRLPAGRFDRKLARSVEAQGLRLLHCAARLGDALDALGLAPERIALTAAIPEVDAPSPGWEAVAAMREQPGHWLAQWFAHTPPLHSLTLLNSSVMAHIAEALACRGPMAGYCGQDSAGLDALAAAMHAVAEHRADAALVVSASPNLTPALFLREAELEDGGVDFRPGEGAAAWLLSAEAPAGRRVRIAGFGRGYVPASAEVESAARDCLARVMNQALGPERLSLGDLAAVYSEPEDVLLGWALGRTPVHGGARPRVGALGASSLLTDLAYALASPEFSTLERTAYLLFLNRSYTGQVAALVLALEPGRTA
ncbi:MAG: beta-ketoacyl synthase [Gammaproteobacteria bacterium]|nr:beta-ketoacyl synthase [Gammaproteobacteria bacterium]